MEEEEDSRKMSATYVRSTKESTVDLSDITEEFLTCPICTEEFADPRMLPCLHSFCHHCISDYIVENTREVKSAKSFACPVCQANADAVNPTNSVQTWADDLPVNNFIFGLIDAIQLRTGERQCDPCKKMDKSNMATIWCHQCGEAMCDSCTGLHNSMKYSTGHITSDIDEVKQTPVKTTQLRLQCPKHEAKFLDYYCSDHGEVLCTSCVTSNHRDCKSVQFVSEAAATLKHDGKYILDNLSKITEWSVRVMENRKQCLKDIQGAADSVKDQIKSIRNRVNAILDVQEKKMIAELKQHEVEEAEQFEKEKNRCKEIISITRNANALLKNSLKHGTDTDVLSCMAKIKSATRKHEKEVRDLSRGSPKKGKIYSSQLLPIPSSRMKEDSDRTQETSSESTNCSPQPTAYRLSGTTRISGDISARVNYTPISPGKLPAVRKGAIKRALPDTTFVARTPNDRDNACLTGATFLSDGKIVLVDQVHRKIKLYDDMQRWVSEKVLSARPYDITEIAPFEIAVTIPKEKRVLILYVRNPEISVSSSFQTGSKCWGISSSQGTIAVSCYTAPPCVKLMTRDGREIKTINADHYGHQLFFFPEYVAFDKIGETLYVTDRYKKSVISVTVRGEKRWELKPHSLKAPRGITVHGTRVYIAGSRSHNICAITTMGEMLGDVIKQNLSSPHKVCLNSQGDTMLVTQHAVTLIPVEKNTVKLFKLQTDWRENFTDTDSKFSDLVE
ncbi:TRIM56 [Mytilus edulis]|uniref:TRIM56 n=1 Tax=Mytilus edulis TaxID=6550 RepID=A0A8S3T3F5_MYTED|nr:TRIM56 [Mytilus edulis]